MKNRGADELTVWGSGMQMRDFIHIEDCITGVLQTIDKIDNGDAVNLSTGKYTSFIEFAQFAAAHCGYTPRIQGTSNTPEGVFARGGDTAKQCEYGFQASIDFQEGISKALQYYETKGA